MAKRVFCIGNGESRSPVDLIKLRPHGKIYGCNGLYRDFTPDVLTSVDGPMMHEIYQSGYCDNNETWLRDWNPIPGMTYNSIVFANLTPSQIDIAKKNFKIYENKRGDKQNFVFHGSAISGQVAIIRRMEGGEQIEKKQINHTGCYVSWINPEDKANNLKDVANCNRDRGWACGATSGWVALNKEKDIEELYMIGHDLKSNTDQVNNMYKSTQNYSDEKNKPIPHVNWVTQWKELMKEFPKVKFIKVNPDGIKGNNAVSSNIEEWNVYTNKNLSYMTFKELNETFDCI
tara:strand:- start:572 stop:1435 length:864 start_codon:yes stop_codon:yes gene_type:complete